MSIISLTEAQRLELNHDTTEVTPKELQDLIDKKGEQWKQTPAGKEIIALLEEYRAKNNAVNQETQKALERERQKNAKLQEKDEALRKSTIPRKDEENIPPQNLIYAPTTAINVVRLAQLGFFPMDFSEGVKGDWKSISKWRYVSKGIQSLYITIGKAGAQVEKFSDKVTLVAFDADANWAKYHAELLKGVQKEIEAWIQSHPDQKPRIESARASLSAMQMAFANGKYEEGYKYAVEAMDQLRMNTSGDWHMKSNADRTAEKSRIQSEASIAQSNAVTADKYLENAKNQKKAAQKYIEAKKGQLSAMNDAIHDMLIRNNLDLKYADPKNGIRNIDTRIAGIDRIIWELNANPVSDYVPKEILDRTDKNILRDPRIRQPEATIQAYRDTQGYLSPDGSTVLGKPGNPLESAKMAYEASKGGFDEASKKSIYDTELGRSKQIEAMLQYREDVRRYLVAITEEKRKLNTLKPQVKARDVEQKKLEAREKTLPKYDERISKRSETATSTSMRATEMVNREVQIIALLDRLSNPDTPNAEKIQINAELTTLIGNKNTEATRLLTELQTAPKGSAGIPQRTRVYRELMSILGLQEGAYDKIKEHFDRAEQEIKSIREEQMRVLAEYDLSAKKAANGPELEAIVAKSKQIINAYNTRREEIIASLGAEFDKAKITLQPIQYDKLLKTSPLAKYFDKIDKFNGSMETGKGKGIMRGMYGALMLASIGQIGMTATQDKRKAAMYAGDMAIGFIPFGIGGLYDVGIGLHSAITGKHYLTGDQVKFSDAAVRVGLGIVGIVTFGASNLLKGLAKADKMYDVAKAAMTTSKGISHGYVIWQSASLGYGLIDVGRSMVEGDIGKNWDALKRNDPNLPAQQKWFIVIPKGYEVNGVKKSTP